MANRFGKLGRRAFLGSIGASAAVMPFLPIAQSEAEGTALPKRLVIFCTPNANGFYPNGFNITAVNGGNGNDADLSALTLPPIITPLGGGIKVRGVDIEDLTPAALVLEGIDLKASYQGPIPGAHLAGLNSVLTGQKLQPPTPGASFTGGGADEAGWADGISIDHFVADAIGTDTPRKTLNLGVGNFGGTKSIRFVMSYRGPGNPVPVSSDPYKVFDNIFGDFMEDPEELARIRAERQSVIDFVKGDLDSVKTKISTEDAHKVDAHLDAVRSIEQRLTGELDCTPPALGTPIDVKNGANDGKVAGLQMDLLVEALQCGITNVGSILFGGATNQGKFGFVDGVDGNSSLHQLTHQDGTAYVKGQCRLIAQWYCKQLAYFCQRLKNIPEGDGTMLDNTLVMWCSETSIAKKHDRKGMPFVLMGSCGGYFKTGRRLTYDNPAHNKLLTSIAHAFGQDVETFGLPGLSTGPLGKLTG